MNAEQKLSLCKWVIGSYVVIRVARTVASTVLFVKQGGVYSPVLEAEAIKE